MKLRSFNPEGVERVQQLLDSMRAGETSTVPAELLYGEEWSNEAELSIAKPPDSFESRYQLALWLNLQLDGTGFIEGNSSVGTWTWLAMVLLDIVAPARADNTRNIRDRALYVLEPNNWRRYYRHLLAGPARVMRAHWNELQITQAILAGKPSVPGELYEQIASRQEVVTSRAIVALTRDLYWDSLNKKLKTGTGGKAAGSPRRLSSLLQQLDVTWDFGEMTEKSLFALLPEREYARFAKQGSSENTVAS